MRQERALSQPHNGITTRTPLERGLRPGKHSLQAIIRLQAVTKEERLTKLREQVAERERQRAEFRRWEAQQPPLEREPARILADLGTIWSWLPPEVRAEDPDPEKRGVQAMHAALSHLTPRS